MALAINWLVIYIIIFINKKVLGIYAKCSLHSKYFLFEYIVLVLDPMCDHYISIYVNSLIVIFKPHHLLDGAIDFRRGVMV